METHMSTRMVVMVMGCVALIMTSGIAQASIPPKTYDLWVIGATALSPWNMSSDLDLSVEVSLVGSQIEFKLSNDSLFDCSITQIYFDDDAAVLSGIALDGIDWGTQTGVDFVVGSNNGKLPGGENLTPRLESDPSLSFGASSVSPVAPNGINKDQWLSLTFDLNSGKTFADVTSAMDSEKLRIGLHVQAFPDGSSASYTTGTPEPATIALLGLGTTVLWRRRKP